MTRHTTGSSSKKDKFAVCKVCSEFVRAGLGHSGYCKYYSFNKGKWVGTIQTARKMCYYANAGFS